MEFIEYTTLQNDRWDLISYKFYGVVDKFNLIQEANEKDIPPDILYSQLLPMGLKLKIPILEEEPVQKLPKPVWKE
jgi:phage tail protein X